MAQTNVSFEMNDKLKDEMEEICEDLGMSMDDAFQIFARKMVNEQGIPFEVTERDYPVDETEEKIKKAVGCAAIIAVIVSVVCLIAKLCRHHDERRHHFF